MDIVNTASIIHSVTLIMLLNEALAGKKIQQKDMFNYLDKWTQINKFYD